MAALDLQVSSGADDAKEGGGSCATSDEYIECWSVYPDAGMRFQNVTLSGSDTVTSAYLSLRIFYTFSPDLDIFGEDIDNAPPFTTADYNITSRTKTSASVLWDESGTPGAWENSPDISSIIQEIIDRPGWSSGSDIVIWLESNSGGDILFHTYDEDPANAPKLHIEYTTGGGGGAALPAAVQQYRQRRT